MPANKENRIIHEKVSPGHERRIFHLENLMVVVCDFTNSFHPIRKDFLKQGKAKDPGIMIQCPPY